MSEPEFVAQFRVALASTSGSIHFELTYAKPADSHLLECQFNTLPERIDLWELSQTFGAVTEMRYVNYHDYNSIVISGTIRNQPITMTIRLDSIAG